MSQEQAPRPPSTHHSPEAPKAPFAPTYTPSNAPLPPTYGAQPTPPPPPPQPSYTSQPQHQTTYNLTPEAYQLHARALTGDTGKADSGRSGQGAASSNAHLAATASATRLPGGFVDYEKPPPGSEAEVREYLNEKVMPHILNGLKVLARERPVDPLKALGEFLIEQSKK
ncbi:hypothetical protein BJ508DRAFT_410146 [Ascobolus immersus RN42]|uniref:Uncharacterized protein n=1 Tax=Ascobolus immersus RN42 TaxID=1160509 RepID=A0A3N4IQ50_ASCIM|nr:hypothetical protein BJ508DRAFT_410146 [Ascobolus immersus RN42]